LVGSPAKPGRAAGTPLNYPPAGGVKQLLRQALLTPENRQKRGQPAVPLFIRTFTQA
jgi:hypothetical protein